MLIYGINAVLEALRARRVKELRVAERPPSGRIVEAVQAAVRDGIDVRRVTSADLDRAARGGVHQGVVAQLIEADSVDIPTLVASAHGAALIVVLDGI